MKWFVRFIWFVILTVVTQVGGCVYLFNLFVSYKWFGNRKWFWLRRQILFGLIYVFVSLMLVPTLAKLNNRRPLPFFNVSTLQPQNWFTVICNRHYVHEDLYNVITAVSADFDTESIENQTTLSLNYLDANFPLFDGFPLIPHLSHNDGKKLDISFRYKYKGE
ncbi:MAG: hypothetical protein ACI9JN_001766, partial [Bacteroidia bacterium]